MLKLTWVRQLLSKGTTPREKNDSRSKKLSLMRVRIEDAQFQVRMVGICLVVEDTRNTIAGNLKVLR